MQISFTVEGQPRGKGRPRFTRTGHAYTDAKTKAYERKVAKECKAAMGDMLPTEKGVIIQMLIRVAPPASSSKKRMAEILENKTVPIKRPDIDNVFKAVADGCNGIAYRDDKQIVGMEIRKAYALEAGVDVLIMEVQ